MNATPEELADVLAEVVERINLVRARLADEEAEDRGEPGHAVELWNTVYGLVPVSARDLPAMREKMAQTYGRKLDAASLVINKLAWLLAAAEGVEPSDVLDRAEREMTETFQRLTDEASPD